MTYFEYTYNGIYFNLNTVNVTGITAVFTSIS